MRITDRDAVGWAQAVAAGAVTPAELVEAAQARAEAINPLINAIAAPLWERARLEAAGFTPGESTPALAGVPCLIKDLTVTLAGVPHTAGSRLGRSVVATKDSRYARRLIDAGLIVAGVATTPEFGGSYVSESASYGPTRNPWDLARSAGGSSAGSAAAVAAGIVPLAHGNDAGGSIRVPASCCGLFGFKPSRGAVIGEHPPASILGRWQVEHVITRSVRDSSAVLDLAAAEGPRPVTAPTYLSEHLRIAVTLDASPDVPIAPECRLAVESAASLLEALGHHVELATPPTGDAAADRAASGLWADAVAGVATELGRRAGRAPSSADLEPRSWTLLEQAAARTPDQRSADAAVLGRLAREIGVFFESWDVWLGPCLSEPPPRLEPAPCGNPAAAVERDERLAMNLPLANVTGGPAMALPLYRTAAGLPVGVHLMGRPGEDRRMLSLAAQIEATDAWLTIPDDLLVA